MHLVVFDLETTGYSPRYHEIIQVAAVRLRHGEVIAGESFATLVRPQGSIPDAITGLTGIADDDVRSAPEPAEALAAFSQFAGDATLIAHNGRRFDLPFIREVCLHHRLPMREVPFIDSMTLSRKAWAGGRSHNLDAVMERLELSAEGLRRHDARDDVRLLAEAVRRLWYLLGASPSECPVPLDTAHLPR